MSFNRIIDSYQDKLIRKEQGHDVESDNDDELLNELDDELDVDFQSYREQRMQELSQQMKLSRKHIQEAGHGRVETLLSEDAVLKTTTSTKRIVLHFFHAQFEKCSKMDKKLEILAQKHISTKFIRIDVDNAPFLVTRLGVKVLPVVLLYINGVESARIIGFDRLSYDPAADDFTMESLENFLLEKGAIEKRANDYKRILKQTAEESDESDLDL